MSLRLALMLPLAASMALPGVAAASQGQEATRSPIEHVTLLAQAERQRVIDDEPRLNEAEREVADPVPEAAGRPPTTPPPGGEVTTLSEPGEGDPLIDARRRELEKHQLNMARIERIDSLATTANDRRVMQMASHLRELEERRHEAVFEHIARRVDVEVEEGRAAPMKKQRKGGAR